MGIPACVKMINFVNVVMIPTQTNGQFVLIVTGPLHLTKMDFTYVMVTIGISLSLLLLMTLSYLITPDLQT